MMNWKLLALSLAIAVVAVALAVWVVLLCVATFVYRSDRAAWLLIITLVGCLTVAVYTALSSESQE